MIFYPGTRLIVKTLETTDSHEQTFAISFFFKSCKYSRISYLTRTNYLKLNILRKLLLRINSEIATMPENVFESETILTFQNYVCGQTNWL